MLFLKNCVNNIVVNESEISYIHGKLLFSLKNKVDMQGPFGYD